MTQFRDGRQPHDADVIGEPGGPIAPERLGSALIEPGGAFEAGSFASFTLTYTAGRYGIDDSGSLRICWRFASDMTPPQFTEPTAPGFTTVEASNGAVLEARFDPKGNLRPWDKTLYIKVVHGFLAVGDKIVVRPGDRRQGSAGMRLQTFCEDSFEFRVLVDPIATFLYQALPEQPTVAIVPGPPERFVAVLPTLRRKGEPFALRIKAEDRWGNPSERADATLRLRASLPVEGLPASVRLEPGRRAVEIEGLQVHHGGDLEIELLARAGEVLARSNPMRVANDPDLLPFWADLHGQSEETIGTNSARAYFTFARDLAFVDAAAHQGNDFQITAGFWAELNRLTAEFNAPGRFVTLPGYEWSGNTALGGDRNVLFASEGRPIRRSSHALIADRSDLDTDCDTAADLFEALSSAGEDAICFAHCGGRHADIRQAHDGRVERSVEVHSAWGTFEWLLRDALDLGHRVGVVCNSDGHKGRPGASYPGASMFGAIGGLTCLLMPALTRADLVTCLRRRRHYGTTGCRLHLDVRARLDEPGTLHHDDPALGPAEGFAAQEALMGDLVHPREGDATLRVWVLAGSPIERLDLFNGTELIETIRPYGTTKLGARIRVVWQGAAYRGRFRQVIWDGAAAIEGNRILDAKPVNFLNPEKRLEREGDARLTWRSLTTGNLAGFDVWLEDPRAGRLRLETPLLRVDLPIAEIGLEDTVFDLGGLDRRLRVFRLPERNPHRSLGVERRLELRPSGDNAIHARLTLEDGHQAWSSPIYIWRG
jgi:hypothetical protein